MNRRTFFASLLGGAAAMASKPEPVRQATLVVPSDASLDWSRMSEMSVKAPSFRWDDTGITFHGVIKDDGCRVLA